MRMLRGVLAVSLCLSLCFLTVPIQAGGKPLGILTLAYSAHLNASDAFAGLSVFAGERMTTDPEGKAMVRIGASVVTLSEASSVTLEHDGDGAHVDVFSGCVVFSSTQKNPLEVHAEEAMLRPHGEQDAQAQILIFSPKVLQVTTKQGSLDIFYRGEFRVLPAGMTYRIYLESEAEPQGPAGAGSRDANDKDRTEKAGMSKGTKVAYFILAGAGAGLAAWGIHDAIESSNGMESPAKP